MAVHPQIMIARLRLRAKAIDSQDDELLKNELIDAADCIQETWDSYRDHAYTLGKIYETGNIYCKEHIGVGPFGQSHVKPSGIIGSAMVEPGGTIHKNVHG